MRASLNLAPVLWQVGAVLVALPATAFCPPARGEMLLVPITRDAGAGLAARAVGRGALLAGRGPFGGSLVVMGDRGRLASLALSGVVLVAPPAALCGAAAEKAGRAQ